MTFFGRKQAAPPSLIIRNRPHGCCSSNILTIWSRKTAGEYYTPRPLIRAKIHVVNPKIGERIYGGKVGSAGFLCEAYVHLSHNNSARLQLSRIAGQIDGVQV
jgi:hypothetical protein